jgi:hypothetical protein
VDFAAAAVPSFAGAAAVVGFAFGAATDASCDTLSKLDVILFLVVADSALTGTDALTGGMTFGATFGTTFGGATSTGPLWIGFGLGLGLALVDLLRIGLRGAPLLDLDDNCLVAILIMDGDALSWHARSIILVAMLRSSLSSLQRLPPCQSDLVMCHGNPSTFVIELGDNSNNRRRCSPSILAITDGWTVVTLFGIVCEYVCRIIFVYV